MAKPDASRTKQLSLNLASKEEHPRVDPSGDEQVAISYFVDSRTLKARQHALQRVHESGIFKLPPKRGR